jgi:hypothetical protein
MSDERRAPVQPSRNIAPGRTGRIRGTVSWEEHLEAFEDYARLYGRNQSAERIAERGGFSYFELVQHLHRFPDSWRPA